MESNDLSSCELWKKAAEEVYIFVLYCGIQQHCRLAGEVATKLGLIAGESLASYEVDDEVETLASTSLRILSRMCVVRMVNSYYRSTALIVSVSDVFVGP